MRKVIHLISCVGFLLGGFLTTSSALGADEIPEDQMEAGDVMLSKSVPGKHSLYHLWPGDGKRGDDPSKDLKEVFDSRVKKVSRPSMMLMQPDKPNGKAVIIFPGGGYGHLAARKEGSSVGEWLNQQGITAFVVKYRVPKRKGVNVAFQDAQRAIRLVRGNAKRFGIDPGKVGVMGFSAGGHLSAMTIHQFDVASYPAIDAFDKIDCKPNFGVLIYPAYLGKSGKVSADVNEVKDASIPIFIAISKNDSFIDGVEAYVPILKAAKVPYEYHAYDTGKHGTGLGGFPWVGACEAWLKLEVGKR
jgi:acetyl esterase/lipase